MPPAAPPRFRSDDSWIETLGRDVALAVVLVAALVAMENLNDWVIQSTPAERIWRYFLLSWRQYLVGQLVVVFLVAAVRPALPAQGTWRWISLALLVVAACAVGWQVEMRWRAVVTPRLAPFDVYTAHAMQHQLVVTTALMVGLHEFLRISRRAEASLHEAQLRRIGLDGELAAGRLQVLQAQIEPHFLFNSLANLRRLMRIDGPAGQAMLGDLLRYLEVALPRMRDDHSTLGRDAELVRAFLSVHQVRMGTRLRVEIDIAPELASLSVPPMMLLTLVENALKHGLNPLPEGGLVRIGAQASDGRLVVSVADTGRGLVAGSGGGTGLANIRARLKAMYGAAGALTLQLNEPRGVVAAIALPQGAT
ncbi:MAG: histidine kinase [Pseudomonadota bacterium]|nr:histidine kinase [Pseudomonadota bacterium]